jgi:hypothetical protein
MNKYVCWLNFYILKGKSTLEGQLFIICVKLMNANLDLK